MLTLSFSPYNFDSSYPLLLSLVLLALAIFGNILFMLSIKSLLNPSSSENLRSNIENNNQSPDFFNLQFIEHPTTPRKVLIYCTNDPYNTWRWQGHMFSGHVIHPCTHTIGDIQYNCVLRSFRAKGHISDGIFWTNYNKHSNKHIYTNNEPIQINNEGKLGIKKISQSQ